MILIDPVTIGEISKRTGIERERLYQWRQRKYLPLPDGTSGKVLLWEWPPLRHWLLVHGHLIGQALADYEADLKLVCTGVEEAPDKDIAEALERVRSGLQLEQRT